MRVAIESATEHEMLLHISVADTGIGIPPDKQSASSRRSARPTAPPPGSMAAPAWGSRLRSNW